MTAPDNLFQMYEPRPEYATAVRVTEDNVHELARYINYQRSYYGANRGVVAVVHPSSAGDPDFLILQAITDDGILGGEITRAYPWQHYLVQSQDGYQVVIADEFRPLWRKCLGDER